MNRPSIGGIFRCGFERFVQAFGPQPLQHLKVATAIGACRTPQLGAQRECCDHCGAQTIRYHSCRNRHCPQCQGTARMGWVSDRLDELLPVGYFHVVFTIPSELNGFALRNQKVFYDLLFRAVKETMLELAANPARLGADIGFVALLHTWGQTMMDHPHVHCIVPGGGYDAVRGRWKASRNGFLFPIAVLRKLFRGKLMALFTEAVENGTIALHGKLAVYARKELWLRLVDELYTRQWVVYVKAPFASPQALVKYLGNYTHRVAIANSRILHADHNSVTFSYKDYAADDALKTMTVSTVEFIRRFMMHVLPQGFKRIRYFGFLAPRAREKRLNRCRRFFSKKPCPKKKRSRPWYQVIRELTGKDPLRCGCCGIGTLRSYRTVRPTVCVLLSG